MTATGADNDRLLAELQALLRVDTTNPPGNEAEAIALMAGWLSAAGITPTVLRSDNGRANLVARIKGDGSQAPLLLAGHVDVVGVEAEMWKHPPFSGHMADGYVWGRGAIDMKNFLVMAVEVLRRLQKHEGRLKRDVIFAAVADEEAGCDEGSRFLVEQHPELVRAEYMLGEVGGFSMYVGGKAVYPVMVAEKGIAWLRATFRGEPGHGSVPQPNTAILKLARFVDRLGRIELPHHATRPARLLIDSLARAQGGLGRVVLPQMLRPELASVVLKKLFPDKTLVPWFSALLRNTATPTIIGGGVKINQIPGRATLELDGRTLPGFSAADLIAELQANIGHDAEFEVLKEMAPVETTAQSPLFELIASRIVAHEPEATVIPYMIPGFTDAKQFSRLGTKCYGFSPVRFPREDGIQFGKLYHGHNERIHAAGFLWGARVFADVVARFAGAPL